MQQNMQDKDILNSVSFLKMDRVQKVLLGERTENEVFLSPPDFLEIQPTTHCIRNCIYCSHKSRNRVGAELNSEVINRLTREFAQLDMRRIAISGGGEPLEWKSGNLSNTIAELAKFSLVSLTTNGDAFWNDKEEELSESAHIILNSCDDILINVPAVTNEGFRTQVSGHTTWDRLRKTIERLVSFRGSNINHRFKIHCVVVVNKYNAEDLEIIDRTLQDLSVDKIYYKQLKDFEQDSKLNDIKVLNEKILKFYETKTISEYSKGLRRFFNSLTENTKSCSSCWVNRLGFSAIIDPQGDVYLCTPTVGIKQFSIGNIVQKSFWEIWTSQRRSEIILALDQLSTNGFCPSECRYHGHNRIMDAVFSGKYSLLEILEASNNVNAGLEDPS